MSVRTHKFRKTPLEDIDFDGDAVPVQHVHNGAFKIPFRIPKLPLADLTDESAVTRHRGLVSPRHLPFSEVHFCYFLFSQNW